MSLNFILKLLHGKKKRKKKPHYGKFKKMRELGEMTYNSYCKGPAPTNHCHNPIKNGQRLGIDSNQKTEMALKCMKQASASLIN